MGKGVMQGEKTPPHGTLGWKSGRVRVVTALSLQVFEGVLFFDVLRFCWDAQSVISSARLKLSDLFRVFMKRINIFWSKQ